MKTSGENHAPSLFVIEPGNNIATVLKNSPLSALETRVLLMHGLQLTRTQLITQDQQTLNVRQTQSLSTLFQRRQQGEPIAYIIGQREFYGLQLEVTPDVLIPRSDTELLVDLVLQHLPTTSPPSVLDLGTGSGAIAIAIAYHRRDTMVTALDISNEALTVAKRNAIRHLTPQHTSLTLLQSDWYTTLSTQSAIHPRFDIIVANPPYIVAGDPHLSQGDLRFEPMHALTDHADGLSALRIIVNGAAQHLKNNGWLFMEHGYDQAAAVRALLFTQQFEAVQSWQDLAGIERVSGGKYVHPDPVKIGEIV